jgi:pimeloyl-ACP methyl ester carboxylesterase
MSRPEAAGVVRQSGLIQATADTSKLLDLFRTMVDNDLRVQFATFEAIAGSTDPKLPAHISCPALLVGGDRDRFVTPAHLRRTQASLHDARLEIYERASHYLPLEHPHRLTADIDAFLKEVL